MGFGHRYDGAREALTLDLVYLPSSFPSRQVSSHRKCTSVARILVADDDEADRQLIQAILERAGHETVLVEDGEKALSACRSERFDVVIADLQMPKVHGFELITALRESDQPPPIIAVSGTGHHQLAIADALGAKFTLSKPADPDALLTAVHQLLRFAPD